MAAEQWDDSAYRQAVEGFEQAGVSTEAERMMLSRAELIEKRAPNILDDRDTRLDMAADALQPIPEDEWEWLDAVMRGGEVSGGELRDLIISPGGEIIEVPTEAMQAARDAFHSGNSISEALTNAGVENVDVEVMVSVVDALDVEQIGMMEHEDWRHRDEYMHPPHVLEADSESGFVEVPAEDFYMGLGAHQLFGRDEVAEMLPQHSPEAIAALLDEYEHVMDEAGPQRWVGDNPPDWLDAIEAEAARGADLGDGRTLFYDESSERRLWDEVERNLPITPELAEPGIAKDEIETEIERSVFVEPGPEIIEVSREWDIDIDIDIDL